MRIFVPDGTDDIAKIAGEMFNIELGRYFYDNGIKIEDRKDKPYPAFDINDIRSSIRTQFGILILPDHIIDQILPQIQAKLEEFSNSYVDETGKSHCDRPVTFKNRSNYYSSIQAKNDVVHKTNAKARQTFREYVRTDDIHHLLSASKPQWWFVWIIMSVDKLYYSIENCTSAVIPAYTQLVSILYDADKSFIYANNTSFYNEISFGAVKKTQNYKDIIYTGTVTETMIRKIEINLVKLRSSGKPISDLSQELMVMINNYNTKSKHPNFILSTYLSPAALTLCPIRGGAFELIRHLGLWDIYNNIVVHNPKIHDIQNKIYKINYTDAIIDNNLTASLIDKNLIKATWNEITASNDRCGVCNTPLYDEIYMVFPNCEINMGYAVCGICMHSTFNITNGQFYCGMEGTAPYRATDIVARLTYPRKVNELIQTLEVDNEVKQILTESFNPNPKIEIINNNRALYLTNYLVWGGTLTDFIIENIPSTNINDENNTQKIIFIANVLHPVS